MLLSHSPAATCQLLAPSRRTRLLTPCPRAGAMPAAEASGLLPGALRAESLPRHVAVVMDGNARWARARGLPSAAGHEAGRRALEETVRLSRAWGVRALTAFAFSHENWSRPKVEVEFLMGLFERVIRESIAEFLRYAFAPPVHSLTLRSRLAGIPDKGRNPATCNRRLLKTTGFSTEDGNRSGGGHKEQLTARPDTGDQLQRAEGHSASVSEPRAEGARQGAQAGGHRRVAVRRRARDEPCQRAPVPGPAHQDQRRAPAEQLPAVAVGVLGTLLHGHAVARLRGGRLPRGPGLLPEQGQAVRCQEIVGQSQTRRRRA